MESYPNPENIRINDFDYPLPYEKIAQFPLDIRDRSKLLINNHEQISRDIFLNLACYLPEGSLIVFNETRVIHARLIFQKASGSMIEIFCLEPLWPFRDHIQALQQKTTTEWKCLVGNSKRWKSDKIESVTTYKGIQVRLQAERAGSLEGGTSRIKFQWSPGELSFAEVLEAFGKIPLPPYINRNPEDKDGIAYQTIYARQDGSVAAPTAGLHFSDSVMASLKEKNIEILKFTLHVGAGTFRPVTSETLAGHEMHAEQVYMPVETLIKLRSYLDKPIIAVGTTTTRLLESLYWHGVKVIRGFSDADVLEVRQWDPYGSLRDDRVSRLESLETVIDGVKKSGKKVIEGRTSLMITPGYAFQYPDILVTNFHQPKSTLLLLIAAFIGENWKKAYQYALDHEFRFLSYGDSCLFFKK